MIRNFDIALQFIKKLKQTAITKQILQIVLFGFVARGEDTVKSDIDIAIIHDSDNPSKLQTEINRLKHEKIQLN